MTFIGPPTAVMVQYSKSHNKLGLIMGRDYLENHESGTDPESGEFVKLRTVCTSAVMAALGIALSEMPARSCSNVVRKAIYEERFGADNVKELEVPYLGYSDSPNYGSRSKATVGAIRKIIKANGADDNHRFELVVRYGNSWHAMLLDHKGKTIMDTAPRKIDNRQVTKITKVRYK